MSFRAEALSVKTSVPKEGATTSLGFDHSWEKEATASLVAASFAGAVFCVLRYRYRNLWAPIFAHGFDDTIGFTWFFFFGPFYGLW